MLLCSSCHQAHHRGALQISGSADQLTVSRPDAHVGARTDAIAALTGMGWKHAVSRLAVDAALQELGPDAALEPLIRRALQRCN